MKLQQRNHLLRGFRRMPPAEIHEIVSTSGSGAQWTEDGQAVTGQVWSPAPDTDNVWLLLAEGHFPGEMRQATRIGGVIASVKRAVYDAHGRRQLRGMEEATSDTAPAVQSAFQFENMPEPAETMPETMPLF